MTVPTPGSAEAITYAKEPKGAHEQRIVLSLSYPLWDAQVSDVFSSSPLDINKWWSTIPSPDISGDSLNLQGFGLPPFTVVGTTPLWLPTLEDIGFQIFVDVAFPDETPGYHQTIALIPLEGGRGKDSTPFSVIQAGEGTEGAPVSPQSPGDLILRSTAMNSQTVITTNPRGSHRYRFEWDPTGGASGGGQITVDLDGVQIYQYDDTDITDPFEPLNNRVANSNCVRPYMLVIGYIAEDNDQVSNISGTKDVPQVTVRVEDVTSTALDTVDATGVLTLAGNAANNETVVINGKTYTFQTSLTDSDGNVLIGANASDSIDNLIAAITLGDGVGTKYATATTLHTTMTAAAGAGDTMNAVARVPGTAGNSFGTTETLATGGSQWANATLTGGVNGTAYETVVWPGWTTANAGGDIDDAVLGERFVLDNTTWTRVPNVESWDVSRSRNGQTDTFKITISGLSATDSPNIFQGSFAVGMMQDRLLNRTLLIDSRVLREDDTATAWKRQIAGVIETVTSRISEDGSPEIVLEGRDRPSKKLDIDISTSFVAIAESGNLDIINEGFNISQILQQIIDVADQLWAGDALGLTDTDINASENLSPDSLTAGPNLLPAITQICDEAGFEIRRRYTVSGTGRYGEIVISRWTRGPEWGIVSDVYGPFARFTVNGMGAPENGNIRRISLEESVTGGIGSVDIHVDNLLTTGISAPVVGGIGAADFPAQPYPPNARGLSSSMAESSQFAFSMPTWQMLDQFGNDHGGGPGMVRFQKENANRRQVKMVLWGHDWPELTDPIEVDDPDHTGLVPASMVNIHANPSIETDTTGFSASAAGTNTFDRNAASARIGGWGLRHVRNDAGNTVQSRYAQTLTAAQYVWSVFVLIPTDWDWGVPTLSFVNYASAVIDHASAIDLNIRDRWQRVFVTATIDPGDLVGDLEVASSGSGTAGRLFHTDGFQLELGEYPTAYADGERPGTAWNGTQHLSASTRTGELFVVNELRISGSGGKIETILELVTSEIVEAIRRST